MTCWCASYASQDTFDEADTAYKKVQSKLEKLVAAHDKQQVDHARELDTAEGTICALREKAANLEEQVRAADRSLSDERSTVAKLRKQLDTIEVELSHARKEQLDQKDGLHAAFGKERLELRNEIEQLIGQQAQHVEHKLAIERQLIVANAKLETLQTAADELGALRSTNTTLRDDLNKMKAELLEHQAMSKELARQKERAKEDYSRVKLALDSERKELTEFKVTADKHMAKLRSCLEEERAEAR